MLDEKDFFFNFFLSLFLLLFSLFFVLFISLIVLFDTIHRSYYTVLVNF